MKLPNAERAFVDLAKLRDYSLSAAHNEGSTKHVFSPPPGIWDLMMQSGCAKNYWRSQTVKIVGQEEKPTTANDM
jgi:hypothetical protein